MWYARRNTFLVAAIGVAALAVSLTAQQAPANVEIFLTQITTDLKVATPLTNITNNPAYDSQPSFLPDGSAVLFSSVRGGGPTQYDIYKYDLASKQVTQVTNSPDNDNSPLVTPDGKTFSAIRSEVPARSEDQRLWRFNLDGSNASVVLPELRRIGYHVWVDATHVMVFVLSAAQGEPNTLQYVDTTTGAAEVIDRQVGRALLMRPGTGTMTYVSQPRGEKAVVKEFNPKTKQITPLVDAVEASTNRDSVWHPRGALLMSAGPKVFAWTPDKTWTEIADLSSAGVANITRMAISPAARGLSNGTLYLALAAESVAK